MVINVDDDAKIYDVMGSCLEEIYQTSRFSIGFQSVPQAWCEAHDLVLIKRYDLSAEDGYEENDTKIIIWWVPFW